MRADPSAPPSRPATRPSFAPTTSPLDLAATRAWRSGEEVHLTPIEWKLVRHLVRNPGRLVTRRWLLEQVWGPQYENETSYLRVYLATLRRKLEPNPAQPRYFITEPGMGFRFEPGEGESARPPSDSAETEMTTGNETVRALESGGRPGLEQQQGDVWPAVEQHLCARGLRRLTSTFMVGEGIEPRTSCTRKAEATIRR